MTGPPVTQIGGAGIRASMAGTAARPTDLYLRRLDDYLVRVSAIALAPSVGRAVANVGG